MSSIAGRKNYPDHTVYGGTKYFVHAVSESIRGKLAPYNVRVMVVSPGIVGAEVLDHVTDPKTLRSYQEAKNRIGGGISADHVAASTAFRVWAAAKRADPRTLPGSYAPTILNQDRPMRGSGTASTDEKAPIGPNRSAMKSRWSDAQAQAFVERYAARGVNEDLALRTYSSRLLGSDPQRVLRPTMASSPTAPRPKLRTS